jgi:hypothetical protein
VIRAVWGLDNTQTWDLIVMLQYSSARKRRETRKYFIIHGLRFGLILKRDNEDQASILTGRKRWKPIPRLSRPPKATSSAALLVTSE